MPKLALSHAPKSLSLPEEQFALQLKLAQIPNPEREAMIIPGRKFRVDFYWPAWNVAVEIEGGEWIIGRHQRPKGFRQDATKYNLLALQGVLLLRGTTSMIQSGELLTFVQRAIALRCESTSTKPVPTSV